MKISTITIKNVKSFKEETTFNLLGDFNILIGPNGSGKSNFLDILSIVSRRYFLRPYRECADDLDNGNKRLRIQGPDELNVGELEQQLEKYIGCEGEESLIRITFIITQQDIANIDAIYAQKDALIDKLRQKYAYNSPHIINIARLEEIERWKETTFSPGEKLEYEINNGIFLPLSSETSLTKKDVFLRYLNCFELAVLLSKDLDDDSNLTTPYLYMGPDRIGGDENFRISLGNSNQLQQISKYMQATSRNGASLLGISTFHFSRKHRRFESKPDGFAKYWKKDKEVKKVQKYLDAVQYGWELACVYEDGNTYEVRIKENDREVPLSQGSSGEKELFNFLLGIYAFRTQGGIVIIDEPELHLHPKWQKLLLSLFKELSEILDNQFIISTHASAFINADSYDHVFRIYKNGEKTSQFVKFQYTGKKISLKMLHQIINGTNNEQIFFADIVILVEGITDRLVFQRILEDTQHKNDKRVVEIVEIHGKSNVDHYRNFLDALKIPNYFIADLDYICQADKTGQIKSLFTPKSTKICEDVAKNPKSIDGNKLFAELENAIESKNIDSLKIIWEYIKSTRQKLRTSLNSKETDLLESFIKEQTENGIFILQRGDIEEYFPAEKGFHKKDLNKVINLLTTKKEYSEWSSTEPYKELREILDSILNIK